MNVDKLRIPELLAPAGSYEKLVTAIHYGADAVYLGGKQYSLRTRAGNFDHESMEQAVSYAHTKGVRVFTTVNIFARNRDFAAMKEYLLFLKSIGVDGLIVSDPGILALARTTVPEMSLHLSTQANVTNHHSVNFWAQQGVSRVNLARELSLEEIRQIRAATRVKLEVFVHGALCISYSGRCLLSTYLTGRDSNQGDCAHPCRYSYTLLEQKREGQYFPVEEDDRGTYIFNSRDLCLLNRLPELVEAGVDSIKIEGRMKSVGYVGAVVRLYRATLDWIRQQREQGIPPELQRLPDSFQEEALKIGTRGWSENFLDGPPDADDMMYDTMRVDQPWAPVGIVGNNDPLTIETRNVLECGDRIEYLGRALETISVVVRSMRLENGDEISRANPGSQVVLETDPVVSDPELRAIFRKKLTIVQPVRRHRSSN